MERQIKQCDNPGCKKTEEQGNHWYKVLTCEGVITVSRVGTVTPLPNMPWLTDSTWKDACGRKCCAEILAAWMGEGDPS